MLRTNTRAQSVQIGAILLFGVLVILFSSWQAFGIPDQNKDVEFNHNQDVQQQMMELRTTINSMPDASVTRSVTLDLGVRYPSRTIFRNPPPSTGTVRTVDTDEEKYAINITGNPVDENLAQLWNKTGTRYNTGAIRYSPRYNEYQNPPQTIYEHSVVFNKFQREDTSLAISEQSIVQGDRITLIFLNGSLSETRVGSTSVDLQPISTQTRTVAIEPKDGNVTLDIPTRMAIMEWRTLLGDNHDVTKLANITGETDPFASDEKIRTIRVRVDANRNGGVRDSYRLQLAKVGVGADATQSKPAYLTKVGQSDDQVSVNSTYEFTIEVRNKYNKPQTGVTVNATALQGQIKTKTKTTGPNGQAAFQYDPSEIETTRINISITDGYTPDSSHDPQSPENMTLAVDVQPEQAGGATTSVGDGSISYYNETPQDTISVPNGIWRNITCTDQLLLSDGRPASKPNANNLQGDVIRLTSRLNNSTGDGYTIDIKLARATDGSWNKKKVIIYDGNGNNQNAELRDPAAERIYEDGESDILELSNYDKSQGSSWSKLLKDIRALEDDSPVVWQTSRMTGRVTVALECDPPPAPPASGVSDVDGTTPSDESSALQFDIQVASGSTKIITDINITTPGNQNSNVESSWKLRRPGSDQVRLTLTNTNDGNQSGGRNGNIKFDGTKYQLKTNAVFSDGAVLGVDMGEIENGNVKLNYNLVDSKSNADVIVTFYFQNDTQFQAYLRVTNVNS